MSMRIYADSSFLVSCYLTDANTAQAKRFLLEHGAPLPFTALHELEVRNAFQLGIFRRLISIDEAREAGATLDADLRSGRLIRSSVRWPAVFRAAARVSAQHAATTGARSVDILHVAAARALRCKSLASFDVRQREVGVAAGLVSSF